jgi:hypothetical protein
MTPTYVHPLDMSGDQRRAAMADVHTRAARATARVAADPKQSRRVRDANARDAVVARSAAARLSS